ncbi:TKL protein kinase [Phytophthora cinnamomi]|uniref:TKL protein kinase n=1 Tax=Phytophthora cinnamomi TaxID=4785 RepID=UPI003559BAC3|nr:TKL protein kinase [Phytophthora cinnamomi]
MYSIDANMFSFSVVLSELDMLSAPYAQSRQQICDSSWCPLQEADIQQKVTKGSHHIILSGSGPMVLGARAYL